MYRGQDSNFGSIYFEFDAEARAKVRLQDFFSLVCWLFLAFFFFVQFVSLIDRMINDCRSEV